MPKLMRENNYETLAEAIVAQAAQDYTRALCEKRRYEKRLEDIQSKITELEIEISDLEEFFGSDRFNVYTKLSGPALMERLLQEAAEYKFCLKDIEKSRHPSR